MKRFGTIIAVLLMPLACLHMRAAEGPTSRGYTTTQVFTVPGKTAGFNFSVPLTNSTTKVASATAKGKKPLTLSATSRGYTTTQVFTPAGKNPNAAFNFSVPLTAVDSKKAVDNRPVAQASKPDPRSTKNNTKLALANIAPSKIDVAKPDPNKAQVFADRVNTFLPLPIPKGREHSLGDWP